MTLKSLGVKGQFSQTPVAARMCGCTQWKQAHVYLLLSSADTSYSLPFRLYKEYNLKGRKSKLISFHQSIRLSVSAVCLRRHTIPYLKVI